MVTLNKEARILCPVCGGKKHTMIREDTELKNFPLYCPKCKQETLINVKNMKISLLDSKS
ncbi:cysteine-rich KTR domain-containing protein [Massilicoli timonensis]|uniref:cysteine-rich KTR domain-containing protein n=1 Tax=Massilicoli timonensis TaxID=2015901 RepID=UPI003F73FE67